MPVACKALSKRPFLVKRFVTSIMTCLTLFCLQTKGQPGMTYDLKKPVLFENRPLGYEKSDKVKFTNYRRFVQNTITHYNFYFNTNVKLNEIVTRAKAGFRDDFTTLIPFYNYSLETTSKDKRNLDSVLDKVNTAILVRDLRNDWTDNMYMLMGEAYYYKNNLDSAVILFQFINYAYAPRDRDNYPIPIGSNYGFYDNPVTNDLIKQAIAATDQQTAADTWAKADKQVMADAAFYPITNPKWPNPMLSVPSPRMSPPSAMSDVFPMLRSERLPASMSCALTVRLPGPNVGDRLNAPPEEV